MIKPSDFRERSFWEIASRAKRTPRRIDCLVTSRRRSFTFTAASPSEDRLHTRLPVREQRHARAVARSAGQLGVETEGLRRRRALVQDHMMDQVLVGLLHERRVLKTINNVCYSAEIAKSIHLPSDYADIRKSRGKTPFSLRAENRSQEKTLSVVRYTG